MGAKEEERRMVDRFRLWAKGGEGGSGCSSVRRSRRDRHGKPDGGNGGRGGDVILECTSAVWDFSNLQHHLNAKRGGHGTSKNKIGSHGADKVAQVPVGTVIHLVTGKVPSVVVSKSITSLDPWEIPDADEMNPSISDVITNKPYDGREALERNDFPETFWPKKNKEEPYSDKNSPFNGIEGRRTMEYTCSDSEEDDYENGVMEYEVTSEMEGEEGEEGELEEEEVQYNVAELKEPGQKLIVAQGGEGGLGNTAMLKPPKSYKQLKNEDRYRNDSSSSLNVADDESQSSLSHGLPGSEAVLILELKSIADVGLVGIPNAGKSTLLGAISRAKPVVGDYAFTTLRPNIGNLNYEDFFSVKVADIPGLIKGAHENRGLGHAFLRHIERTKVLAYVVDLAAALDGKKGVPPWEQLRDLVLELEYHQEGLADRPSLVVANKIDEDGAEDVLEELKRRVRGVPIYPICAMIGEGIPELKIGLRKLVDGTEVGRLALDCLIVD
ncbi:probable GTP-binding protein OBGM, mitochondrial isoform X2 [Aristolochia californica]|uniref:probable GTP-binding protein OBGM, mitochondrial isoform X2 n=1 Tax=Aristolochia californica TaxID=171875 RepID=UPI0035D7F109